MVWGDHFPDEWGSAWCRNWPSNMACIRRCPVNGSSHWAPLVQAQWRGSLLEGAAGIFERGGKATVAAEVIEETLRDLHAEIAG